MLNFCENHLICQGNTYQNLEKQRIFANKSKRQTVWSKGEKGVENGQSSFFSISETKMNEMPVLRKKMAIVASLSAKITDYQQFTRNYTQSYTQKKSDFGCFVFLSCWKPIRWNIISPPAFTPKNRIRMNQTCSFPWLFSCL